MNTTLSDLGCRVEAIDWTNVRAIYKKLQDDFHLITEPFGILLSDADNLHLSHLIATIDSIDRVLDPLPVSEDRANFADALLNFLRSDVDEVSSDFATSEIQARIKNLRNALIACGTRNEFVDTAAKVFYHTEAKRTATTSNDLVDHLKEEWRLAGHMTVLMMAGKTNPRFERFFYLCCEMMTSVDMVKDAASDFRKGELAFQPNLRFYLRLIREFLVPLPILIWRFPKPQNLVRYAFGFLKDVYIKSNS